MTEATKQALLAKNQRLIDMVIARVKRDFSDDIALIGLTGSFSTNDFHEKSDLDLIIVNTDERAWGLAAAFILDDVGYDIYCTPWEPRLAEQASLQSPGVSTLLEMEILYSAGPEHIERLEAYRKQARDLLAQPIGRPCIERADKYIREAKVCYADAMLQDALGPVKYAAAGMLFETVNALTQLNNTYIKRGIKRYWEQLQTYAYLPENFQALYMAVIHANTVEAARQAAGNLLSALIALRDHMWATLVKAPTPTAENLWGTYEELWCNCRNKVLGSTAAGDVSYALFAALGAQNYLDEMTEMVGTPKFDLMADFDADNLPRFRDAFLRAMDAYADVYRQAGRRVEQFDTFEALYEAYMGGTMHQ